MSHVCDCGIHLEHFTDGSKAGNHHIISVQLQSLDLLTGSNSFTEDLDVVVHESTVIKVEVKKCFV